MEMDYFVKGFCEFNKQMLLKSTSTIVYIWTSYCTVYLTE